MRPARIVGASAALALLLGATSVGAAGILAPLSGHCREEFSRCGQTDCFNALGCVATCGDGAECLDECSGDLSGDGTSALRAYRACFLAAPAVKTARKFAKPPPAELADGLRFREQRVQLAKAERAARRPAAQAGGDAAAGASKVAAAMREASKELPADEMRFKGIPNLFDSATNLANGVLKGGGENLAAKRGNQVTTSDKRTCIGCIFVWEQLHPRIGANPDFDDVAKEFERTCQDQPDVFYEACDEMYDAEKDMVDAYLGQSENGGFSADDLCIGAKLCSPGLLQ